MRFPLVPILLITLSMGMEGAAALTTTGTCSCSVSSKMGNGHYITEAVEQWNQPGGGREKPGSSYSKQFSSLETCLFFLPWECEIHCKLPLLDSIFGHLISFDQPLTTWLDYKNRNMDTVLDIGAHWTCGHGSKWDKITNESWDFERGLKQPPVWWFSARGDRLKPFIDPSGTVVSESTRPYEPKPALDLTAFQQEVKNILNDSKATATVKAAITVVILLLLGLTLIEFMAGGITALEPGKIAAAAALIIAIASAANIPVNKSALTGSVSAIEPEIIKARNGYSVEVDLASEPVTLDVNRSSVTLEKGDDCFFATVENGTKSGKKERMETNKPSCQRIDVPRS